MVYIPNSKSATRWLLLDQRMLHRLNKIYIYKNKPLVPLLATDLEGMLGKTVMDKLLMVPVHKPNQLDLLQALNLDLHL